MEHGKGIYHYTGSMGLLGILQGQKIRCTNLSFLNDSMEFRYGHDLLSERDKKEFDALTNVFLGNDGLSVVQSINKPLSQYSEDNIHEVYVACFTENDDEIMNWMAYGKNDVNYCIEFDRDYLLSDEMNNELSILNSFTKDNRPGGEDIFSKKFEKVEYGMTDELLKPLRRLNLVSEICIIKDPDVRERKIQQYFHKMVFSCAKIKSQQWMHENEYRLIVAERYDIHSKKLCDETDIKWRDANGILVPFVEIPIDNRKIKSITFMAKHYSDRVKTSLVFLKKTLNLDFEIKESTKSLVV